MSTDSTFDIPSEEEARAGHGVQIVTAGGFPAPRHPAESDVLARHEGVPGHRQEALSDANILVVGAGGLGSWIALSLARSGARRLTIVDHDVFDLTNASRQLMYGDDVGRRKAHAVAANVAPHMVAGGTVIGMAMPFEAAFATYAVGADVLVVGVDDNRCRWATARYARLTQIPAVFAMLSLDGMRINTFLQGPDHSDPCLWCALPNLDPEGVAPCAASVIASCLAAAAHVSFFVHRALMGWPDTIIPFNWRATDMSGMSAEEIGRIQQRSRCPLCEAPGAVHE